MHWTPENIHKVFSNLPWGEANFVSTFFDLPNVDVVQGGRSLWLNSEVTIASSVGYYCESNLLPSLSFLCHECIAKGLTQLGIT